MCDQNVSQPYVKLLKNKLIKIETIILCLDIDKQVVIDSIYYLVFLLFSHVGLFTYKIIDIKYVLALFIYYNSKESLKKEGKLGRKKEGGEKGSKGGKREREGGPPTTVPHHEYLDRNYHYSIRLFYGSYTDPRKLK